MSVLNKSLIIRSSTQKPHFSIVSVLQESTKKARVRVICFSVDPLMRVWLSGARTNFARVKDGDTFNCFGLGIVQEGDAQFPSGCYVFGNTGTKTYCELTEVKRRECFVVESGLVQMYGEQGFLYLINNGLAAYAAFTSLDLQPNEPVLVSTAAGATGLLLCHLLAKTNHPIIALTSKGKEPSLFHYTKDIFHYSPSLEQALRTRVFHKYFDCVGERQLDTVLQCIGKNGVIALCGASASYQQYGERGIKNYQNIIMKRLKMVGVNFVSLMPKAEQIFKEFKGAKLHIKSIELEQFQEYYEALLNAGGRANNREPVVGKVIVRM